MRTRLWPDFVERDGCVFVEFNIGDLTPAPPSGRRLTDWELFHNHTQLFHEFPSGAYEWVFVERASADLDVYEPLLREEHSDFLRAKQLGETMASMWATKLKQDFPADRFRVFYLHHDATTLRFHKVRPEEGWLTDEEFMSRSEKYLWDGILYDTDYLERPVRRMDSEPGAPVGKGSSRQGVLKGKTRTAGDFDAPSPLGATAVFKGDRTE
jgi:hypothetical protein